MTRRLVPGDYCEDVRFAWERKLEPHLSRYLTDDDLGYERHPASGVSLTESSAPRVYRVAREVAAALGCEKPVTVHQTRADHHMNAQAWFGSPELRIGLIGPAVALLDDKALAAMIGHEIGHHLAHGHDAHPPSLVCRSNRLRADNPLRLACSVAAEMTADRFALLACRDLSATVRLEVASATGVTTDSLGLRELDYLAEVCELVDSRAVELTNGTHPSPELRLYATWLFSRSDVYRRLTDGGPAELPLAVIDEKLQRMLNTPELQRVLEQSTGATDRKKPPSRIDARKEPPSPTDAVPTWEAERAEIAERILTEAHAVAARVFGRKRPMQAESPAPEGDELVDDLEARFRKLEEEDRVADDTRAAELERRFQELEARARK